ncbi:MAG: hypothetical protein MI807_23125, partial [Verrucomicrobiales bacterium]|nr:hypothetical protein [Verrucomicrobiales bacterium]
EHGVLLGQILDRDVSRLSNVARRSVGNRVQRVRQASQLAACFRHLDSRSNGDLRLSESGFGEAARITRNHRLWEIYLVTHADIAPSHVDRDADMVEHILEADLVQRLEDELRSRGAWIPSPHLIENPS